ncbi:MAG: peptidylprolyl isomerase [bacterium]|nr:peptidylprolyl isomerase [bacterium]
MTTAKKGDTVKVHYTGKLEDGTVFDSSENQEPLQFTIGSGQVISGFDKSVKGLRLNESTTIKIPVDEAYGQRREDMIVTADKDQFPDDLDIQKGQTLEIPQPDGTTVHLKVLDITNKNIILDANHPLAGRTLIFDIELIEIV